MERDPELIKKILMHVEKISDGYSSIDMGFSAEERKKGMHHLKLLYDEGFINATDGSSKDKISIIPKDLTSKGYNLLDDLKEY